MTMPPLESLCPDFFAFWEQARGLAPDEQKRLWRALYEDRHRAVFDVYYGRFGSREELDRALTRFPAVVADLRAMAGRVERATADVVPGSAALFALSAPG